MVFVDFAYPKGLALHTVDRYRSLRAFPIGFNLVMCS